jgi:hypothetical protein
LSVEYCKSDRGVIARGRRCPVWVMDRHGIHAPGRWVARLLYLRQLTDLMRRRKGSESCQELTHAPQ